MEELAQFKYNRQPNVYFSKVNLYTKEMVQQYYDMFEEYKYVSFQTLTQMRQGIYTQFLRDTSNFKLNLVLHTKEVYINDKNQTEIIGRSNVIWSQILNPKKTLFTKEVVELKNLVLNEKFNLQWPSTSWIFGNPKDIVDSSNSTYLQLAGRHQEDTWQTSVLVSPDPAITNLGFSDLLQAIEF